MFITDLEYIYVTRASFSDVIQAWDTNIGIKKFKGCNYFASAKRKRTGDGHYYDGCIGKELTAKDVGGAVPSGTAWLVHVSSGVWKRVDQGMVLWDPLTGRVA